MNILISVATKGGIHAELAKWLIARARAHAGVEIDIVNTPLPLQNARNIQVKRFLEWPTADVLFIVDSDCVPPDDAILRIIAHGKAILSIPHPAIKWNPEKNVNETGLMVMWRVADGYSQVGRGPFSGLVECDAVGCSGLAIMKQVFQSMKPPYFEFMNSEDGTEIVLGEDFDFCQRVRALGWKIFADCDAPQTHYVEYPL